MNYFSEKDVIKLDRKMNRVINEKLPGKPIESYTNEKIKNINCLEQVEPDKNFVSNSQNNIPVISNNEYSDYESVSDMKIKLINMKLELEEYIKTIDSLKKIIEREKIRNKELEITYEQKEEKKLRDQKVEMEAIITRHLKFIDQLVNDKKDLNQQCEELMNQFKEIEVKYTKQINEMKEKFVRELKNNKDAWITADKGRKEKWEKEKEKEIKDMTIKSLEPEFERIISKSKQEIRKAEEKYQVEISKIREEFSIDYENKFKQYKEKLMRENDETIIKEKEFLSNKAKEQYDLMEKKFLENREKSKRGYNSQFEGLELERKRDTDRYNEKIKILHDDNLKEIRKIKEEYEATFDEIKNRNKIELNNYKESVKIEQQHWYQVQEAKIREEFKNQLKKIKQEMENERDEQIEIIITNLTEEKLDNNNNEKEKYEKIINEIKNDNIEQIKKLKREIRVLENHIKENVDTKKSVELNIEILAKKLADTQDQLDIRTKELISAQNSVNSMKNEMKAVLMTQKDGDLDSKKKKDFEKLKYNEEIAKLNDRIIDIQRENDKIIDSLDDKHAQQLEDVEIKVKRAILKKDGEIEKLKDKLRLKETTCIKLEELLEKQRNDLINC